MREKPTSTYQQGDNRLLDDDFSQQLAVANERDDFYLAQRMQEREVMGHSRTLYEENRVRELAGEMEREREIANEQEGEDSWREMEEERRGEMEEERRREMEEERRREMEEEGGEVKSKVGRAEEKELERIHEEIAAKQLEMEELAKKLKETTENQRRLQKHIEERKEEIESLRLANQLQKEDLGEAHKALWRKTAHGSQLDDESFARKLQMREDRLQYSHAHLEEEEEEEEPRLKPPPTHSYADDTSEKIPCQWCEKLIPFEQVMLHQVSG